MEEGLQWGIRSSRPSCFIIDEFRGALNWHSSLGERGNIGALADDLQVYGI